MGTEKRTKPSELVLNLSQSTRAINHPDRSSPSTNCELILQQLDSRHKSEGHLLIHIVYVSAQANSL